MPSFLVTCFVLWFSLMTFLGADETTTDGIEGSPETGRRGRQHFYPYHPALPHQPTGWYLPPKDHSNYFRNDPVVPPQLEDPVDGWPSDDDHQAQLRQFSALHFLISRILAIRQSGITGLFTPGEQLSTSALVTNLMNSLITRNNASLATAGAQGLTNPLSSLFGLTSPFSLNPNGPDALSLYDSCSASGGRSNDRLGVCLPSALCSIYPNARANGTCGPLGANVCCFNTASTCGTTVILNNTVWQSPVPKVLARSSCNTYVKLDNRLFEQRKPVCQVRLDFNSFTLAQPDKESVCSTDAFRVIGAANKVPVICGDNSGQHMYLDVPSPTSNLELQFSIGESVIFREWDIKISMIPCGASYIAPRDCLQYFTSTVGVVKSFNWKDVASTSTRQLANQDYKICFRTEVIRSQMADRLCLKPCFTKQAESAFSLSRATDEDGMPSNFTSQSRSRDCNNDYLVLTGGYDPSRSNIHPAVAADRFCGERFNPAPLSSKSTTVCTQLKSFGLHYKTNGDETLTPTSDGETEKYQTSNGNLGFCLNYQQKPPVADPDARFNRLP